MEEEEEVEDEMYEYVEDDGVDDEEEEETAYKKSKKSSRGGQKETETRTAAAEKVAVKRNWTKEKTSSRVEDKEEEENKNKTDIRTAFFKVASNANQAKLKSEKKYVEWFFCIFKIIQWHCKLGKSIYDEKKKNQKLHKDLQNKFFFFLKSINNPIFRTFCSK